MYTIDDIAKCPWTPKQMSTLHVIAESCTAWNNIRVHRGDAEAAGAELAPATLATDPDTLRTYRDAALCAWQMMAWSHEMREQSYDATTRAHVEANLYACMSEFERFGGMRSVDAMMGIAVELVEQPGMPAMTKLCWPEIAELARDYNAPDSTLRDQLIATVGDFHRHLHGTTLHAEPQSRETAPAASPPGWDFHIGEKLDYVRGLLPPWLGGTKDM